MDRLKPGGMEQRGWVAVGHGPDLDGDGLRGWSAPTGEQYPIASTRSVATGTTWILGSAAPRPPTGSTASQVRIGADRPAHV